MMLRSIVFYECSVGRMAFAVSVPGSAPCCISSWLGGRSRRCCWWPWYSACRLSTVDSIVVEDVEEDIEPAAGHYMRRQEARGRAAVCGEWQDSW